MRLEVLLTCLDVLSQTFPGWTEENHEKISVRVSGIGAEVRTLGLLNTKQH